MQLVQERNPDIQAARKSYETAEARIAPAGAWPDPAFTISREKFPSGDRMNHLMVEQDIPFPGKKTLDAKMKHHEAMLAETNYRAKLLQVLADARILYYKLYRSDQMIRQMTENVEAMKATLRIAQSRLQTPSASNSGGGMGAEVFSLMTELGQMENTLFEEQQTRTMLAYQLNILLDRDLNTPIGPAAAPELIDMPRSLPELLKMAEQNGPMYLSAMHEENHSRAMAARSRLAWAPDFGVSYDRTSDPAGGKGSEAGVRISVPLWVTRPYGEMKEAKAHLREAEAMAKSIRNETIQMVSSEFTEVNTRLTKTRNYRDSILPSAESALKLTRRQYESGNGDYLRLLEASRTLIGVQTEYYNELYHYGEHWARLEQWVGAPLSSDPSTSQEMRHE